MLPMMLAAVSEQTADDIVVTAVLVLSFLALAIVGWVFLRAARRDRRDGE